MKDLFKFLLFLAAAALFFTSSLVSYSAEKKCPATTPIDESTFLSAHGLNKENYSIWLKEHSVWRKKYSRELENYSFIPQGNDKKEK